MFRYFSLLFFSALYAWMRGRRCKLHRVDIEWCAGERKSLQFFVPLYSVTVYIPFFSSYSTYVEKNSAVNYFSWPQRDTWKETAFFKLRLSLPLSFSRFTLILHSVCRRCFVKTIQMAVSQRLLPLRCVICRAKILRLKQTLIPRDVSEQDCAVWS